MVAAPPTTVAVERTPSVARPSSSSPSSPSPSPVAMGRRTRTPPAMGGNRRSSVSPSSPARAPRPSTSSRLPREPLPTAPASTTTPPTASVDRQRGGRLQPAGQQGGRQAAQDDEGHGDPHRGGGVAGAGRFPSRGGGTAPGPAGRRARPPPRPIPAAPRSAPGSAWRRGSTLRRSRVPRRAIIRAFWCGATSSISSTGV